MKTIKCRPILVESKERSCICITSNKAFYYPNDNWFSKDNETTPQQLILISLDPDDKVEKWDIVYDENTNSIGEFIGWTNSFLINTAIKSFNKPKKVIATQSQIPPEYIQQFIREYDNGEIKDIDIEADYQLGNEKDENQNLIPVLVPKLNNGFVNITARNNLVNFNYKVDEDTFTIYGAGKFQEEKLILDKTKASLLFVELWKFLKFDKTKEPILYTEEEIEELVESYLFDLSSTYKEIPFRSWFEQNKKK